MTPWLCAIRNRILRFKEYRPRTMSLVSYFKPLVNCIEAGHVERECGFRIYLRCTLLSTDQTFSITEKRNAVESPNSSHPLSASSAPIRCHRSSRLTFVCP